MVVPVIGVAPHLNLQMVRQVRKMADLGEEGQKDSQGDVIHVVHGVQVTHDKEHGSSSCCQRTVHLSLFRQCGLHNRNMSSCFT